MVTRMESKIPREYVGREQAYVKHTILRSYLQRLFMIVGQAKEPVINYVDCFAGPWQEESEHLRDTSIGISLEQMATCQQGLKQEFDKHVIFRALYIEKDAQAFSKLEAYLARAPFPGIETHCLQGDYTDLLNKIVPWCGESFTFFFVDPKGWQHVVGGRTMRPLLELRKCEFLINLMYEFINRFVGVERHAADMIELFGEPPSFKDETPDQRRDILRDMYRKNMKTYYGGRSAYVTVEKPGMDRVFYYLVYLTRHPRGIDVFKAEAEKIAIVQRVTQTEVRLRQKQEKTGQSDMFGVDAAMSHRVGHISDNHLQAREYLLGKLSERAMRIDIRCWADFLEDSDLYPTDFQHAMKQLVKEKKVMCLDADVSKRRKSMICPDRSERWVAFKQA